MGILMRGRKCYTGKVKDRSQYSTDEQFTGEYWVDGKPIYRKTIPFTKDPNISRTFIDVASLNIDKVLSYGGAWTSRTDGGQNPIVSADSDATYNCGVLFYQNQIGLVYGSNIKNILNSGYLTIEYTKTTD